MVWDILEEETGARLTHSFGRIGGMAAPPTPALKEMCREAALPGQPAQIRARVVAPDSSNRNGSRIEYRDGSITRS
jgi:hypothetical protein